MKVKISDNKWVKRAGIIAVLAGLGFLGYTYSTPTMVEAKEATIQEYTLVKSSMTESLSTSGVVKSSAVEQLLGDISSEVTNIYVGIGERVTSGQVLATMNDIDINISILNQEVKISTLKEEMKALSADKGSSKKMAYENAKTAYDNAKITYDGSKILFENGAMSQSELDQSLESYNKSKIDYQNAKNIFDGYDYATEYSILEKTLSAESMKLKSLEQDLLDHKIVASIDGEVTLIDIEEGEVPRESDVMMEIQNLATLKVEASISEYEINDIKLGQEVLITTLGNDNKIYKGLVETIYPSGEVSGSEVFVTVIIDVLDEDTLLKPNFSANIEILTASKEDALMVPYDALVKTGKGYAVQLKARGDEDATFVRVKTGIESDLTIEIISEDLEEGAIILVESDVKLSAQNQNALKIPGMGGGQGRPGGNADH